MNWIKSRLNKDNFWNLMFWLGICFNMAMSEIFDSIFLTLITLFVVPKFLVMFNKVTYTEDKTFFNKQDQSLTDRLPKNFGTVLALTIVLTAFVFIPFFMLNGVILFDLTATTFLGFLLAIPTLYFIYKNCPISILFNKNAWQEEVIGMKAGRYNVNVHSSSTFSSNNIYYTGIEHRNLPSNMYYHRK
ncbi:hypothetical protein [Candidatus Tisiphia endosymbiont of Piscicola geometra]|uniref:hypothetical protein n=1 Tax=Candidatus Tisiphia endosymbiont of Piscicola geometra TaxID=3066273 RepID=UPI00312C9015